ncbi:hypothetical protein TDB9533_01764 [Thalassocella blandensis]|nr:hypothetical protein TDB9533_01764 [Thalassocella blandensis]
MTRFISLTKYLCPLIVLFCSASFAAAESSSPKNAKVFIKEPADGATVQNPVKVVFGIENMMLMPAGVPHSDSGHHHLLVDVKTLPEAGKSIPADDQHIHFGKAQTETTLNLAPGKHTLQLMLGDHLHMPHNPPVVSKKITITVAAPVAEAETKAPAKPNKKPTEADAK